jgi:hypothetical protein
VRRGGRFLAFQDSDDEWLPSKLSKQMSVFESGPARLGMVYSDMQMILKDGTADYFAAPSVLSDSLINPATRFYQVHNLGIQSAVIKAAVLWTRPATSTRSCRPLKTLRCS